jgi:WD40 repeat protein
MDANQMRLSPQGNVIARAGPRGQIDLWEVPSGRWIGALAGGGDADVFPSAVIEFSPDGATLAVRASNKCVLWDVRARTIQRSMPMGGWGWMRFSPDGSVLASGVYGSIIFFDVHTGRVLSENKDPGSAGTAVVFHPGGNLFFASSSSNSIRAWDVRTGRELFSLPQRASLIGGSLFVTPDGKSLISSDASGAVVAWDLTYYNGHIRRELEFRAAH